MEKKAKYETLCIGGTQYKTTLTEKFKNRKNWEAPNIKMVKAYIPGNIPKIFVKEGQKVKEGTKLLILEAMKMKNIVEAPVSGVIKAIHVQEGIRVPKQHLLIEIE
ncbi:MAG TPA: acetyl-CoA carboxylase biotin carboxyl carrier protein subunit [Marinilabiliales bacterium]|jgi:biotin carboxyl carrier protein|nr:acetyl-CoA carboxylase biotin carboxyl carrier protein subunit [Marinilabiliales bacterium]